MKINPYYENLKESYLFSTIAKKVAAYKAANPTANVISLGIGDVTRPLTPAVICAMHSAVDEMAAEDTFKGYGPEQGYSFLHMALQSYYLKKGVNLDAGEIFVGDGAKSDLGNIMDIFDVRNKVLMPDPVYPAYLDVNVMLGRRVKFAVGCKRNSFKPMPPSRGAFDIIYLCSPNNPTGAVYTKAELKRWVDFALEQGAVILFDAAYESYIRDPELPTSIYQIEGAKECAIEICSLSKSAGFTGTRCGYTIVPKALRGGELNKMWNRRQTTKFNGVSYVVQRAAQAVFSEQGQYENKKSVDYYMENANLMHAALAEAGIWHVGGTNSPYIWMECPKGMTSWEYFELALNETQVVGTPGSGFGAHGEGYFRLTAFGNREKSKEAIRKLCEITVK